MPATAATLTQTRQVPLRTTGFTDTSSLTFEKFNVEGFQLDSVDFQFSVHIEGGVRLENQSTLPRTIAMSIGAILSLRTPENELLLSLSPRDERSVDLGAFDGTVDFAGSSGVTLTNLSGDRSGSMSFVRQEGSDVLAQFRGPGNFSRLLSSVSDSGDSGGGALTSIFNAMASAQVTVTYTFTQVEPPEPETVPEPSSLALLGIGGGLTLLCGHWRGRWRRSAT